MVSVSSQGRGGGEEVYVLVLDTIENSHKTVLRLNNESYSCTSSWYATMW